MTVHFRGQCIIVQNVVCEVATETKWYSIQPTLRLQGWCTDVEVINDKAIIK